MTSTTVVGAGAVGLASAYHLRRSGAEVTLVDSATPGSGASSNNAGWIVPSMSVPVPAPGMLPQAIRWMLKRDSPLYVSPSLRPEFVRFMMQMLRSCTSERFHHGSAVLARLSAGAAASFDELVADGVDFEMHDQPLTMLFTDPHKRDARVEELELLDEALPDFSWRVLDAHDLRAQIPTPASGVVAGIESRGDRSVDPVSFVAGLTRACERDGVRVLTGHEAVLERETGSGVTVRVGPERLRADRIVVAAGAWTNRVLAGIGEHVAVQAGKGYGYDFPADSHSPTGPMYLTEGKVAITPLDSRVRAAGTMGFGGLDQSVKNVRAAGIISSLRTYFEDWPAAAEDARPWAGLRPMTPDGVPLIGPLPRCPDVVVATGHAMLGISLAPVTGRLVAEIATGSTDPDLLRDLAPTRF